jgi:hypothetical protein
MPSGIGPSVGSVGGGGYVELGTLARYLSKQYRGMGGAAIASHKFFGRKFGALNNSVRQATVSNGAVAVVLVSVSAIKTYLSEQYEGMGGADIASHRNFLRNCPKVGSPWPANLQ